MWGIPALGSEDVKRESRREGPVCVSQALVCTHGNGWWKGKKKGSAHP